MVERGLIQAPSVTEVIVTAESPRSRYVPLVLPRSGDVEMALALFEAPPPPNGNGEAPTDFMVVFGDAEVHIKLGARAVTADRNEAVLSKDAGAFSELVDRIDGLGSTERVSNVNNNSGECEDSVVGYRLLARMEGRPWVEYLHGPATFQCNDTTDPGDAKGSVSPEGPGGRAGRSGPFEHTNKAEADAWRVRRCVHVHHGRARRRERAGPQVRRGRGRCVLQGVQVQPARGAHRRGHRHRSCDVEAQDGARRAIRWTRTSSCWSSEKTSCASSRGPRRRDPVAGRCCRHH